MKPLIGLNCKLAAEGADQYYKLDRLYVRAVERAGAVPVLLPFFATDEDARETVARLDGLLLTGGPDLDPGRWGEPPHPKIEPLHPDKEESDFRTLRAALARDLAVLGICLGMQTLNVAFGGSIHQHIYDLPGIGPHSGGVEHEAEMTGDSRLREALDGRTRVLSWHHQAANRIGEGLRVIARSADGLVEGIESARHRWVVGVQWHPERMAGRPDQERLFAAFAAASRR